MPGFNVHRTGIRVTPPRRNQFAPPPHPGVVAHLAARRGLGAVSTGAEIQVGSTAAAAGGSAIAVGAGYGSIAGPVGAVVGALVAVIATSLIHQGQGAQRAAQSAAITQALNNLQTGNNIGAQIPWIGTAQNPGLQQFLQAIMTAGIWFNWDPSLISSPAVNGNWANTFIAAVKQVTQAIISTAPGTPISLNITDRPGGNDAVAGTFNFTNPGIGVGPDVIAAKIIMGTGGLMYWMILRTGETAAHASANANNPSAQKVFALMVDHAASDYASQAYKAPAAAAPAAQATATTQQIAAPAVTGTTSAGTPVVAPNDTDALIQQLIAQGASQTAALQAAMASLEANGVNTAQPQVQQQLQQSVSAAASPGLLGLSNTTWLIIGGVAVAAYMISRK